MVSHSQYAYDIIVLADPLMENLWTIKDILRDLLVIGVKVGHILLDYASDFLYYKLNILPFKYTRLLVGGYS